MRSSTRRGEAGHTMRSSAGAITVAVLVAGCTGPDEPVSRPRPTAVTTPSSTSPAQPPTATTTGGPGAGLAEAFPSVGHRGEPADSGNGPIPDRLAATQVDVADRYVEVLFACDARSDTTITLVEEGRTDPARAVPCDGTAVRLSSQAGPRDEVGFRTTSFSSDDGVYAYAWFVD